MARSVYSIVFFYFAVGVVSSYKLAKNDEKCPSVKARSDFDLSAVRIYVQHTILILHIKIMNGQTCF